MSKLYAYACTPFERLSPLEERIADRHKIKRIIHSPCQVLSPEALTAFPTSSELAHGTGIGYHIINHHIKVFCLKLKFIHLIIASQRFFCL